MTKPIVTLLLVRLMVPLSQLRVEIFELRETIPGNMIAPVLSVPPLRVMPSWIPPRVVLFQISVVPETVTFPVMVRLAVPPLLDVPNPPMPRSPLTFQVPAMFAEREELPLMARPAVPVVRVELAVMVRAVPALPGVEPARSWPVVVRLALSWRRSAPAVPLAREIFPLVWLRVPPSRVREPEVPLPMERVLLRVSVWAFNWRRMPLAVSVRLLTASFPGRVMV